ncbi:Hypothetical Protein PANA_2923 [Pantoea ananatis LMG 20103]|uniref:Uncharacterized protein n=1 Tax=Pantoea ananatis (strain LMG 20103) TaxID=706191 RepID=D4GKQ1_PANAM|nr:Imm74 family immunity protein [Pantoea ananatis]ADD78090.1 Hypothetical Protein PANA_2923 [Pantoea ananatis LMG 20103]MDF7791380.1 Imm74 family immunity protein [Pantoea ananatis]NEK84148.1 hypothetical protein [Pantoea ananatis]SFX36788.1 Immunity protein 74 [Pantoea ananatis]
MKITGTSSYVMLDIDGRKIRAEGEMVVGGFVAEKNTMRQFEPPYESEPVTDAVRQRYIDEAVKKTQGSHMVLKFV